MEGSVPVGASALESLDFRKIWQGAMTFARGQAGRPQAPQWSGVTS